MEIISDESEIDSADDGVSPFESMLDHGMNHTGECEYGHQHHQIEYERLHHETEDLLACLFHITEFILYELKHHDSNMNQVNQNHLCCHYTMLQLPCGRRWIRTTVDRSRQIYSLLHLTALAFFLISEPMEGVEPTAPRFVYLCFFNKEI